MNETEQIEEIARDIDGCDDCIALCRECKYYQYPNCRGVMIADRLYYKGYRKASEVAREIIDLIDGWFMYCEKYSGHIVKNKLAELKKKYTEGEI